MLRKLGGNGRNIEIVVSILWECKFCLMYPFLPNVKCTRQQGLLEQELTPGRAGCVCVHVH